MAHQLVGTEEFRGSAIARIYRDNFDLMFRLAVDRFGVPEEDATALVHDVMVSLVQSLDEIESPRKWLVGAICNASRFYWRRRRRDVEGTAAFERETGSEEDRRLRDVVATLTIDAVLARMGEKCRRTLALRYREGCSAREIAEELDTTLRYAEKMLGKCLKKAREIYRELNDQ